MKIWSLLPSATEILFALRLGDQVTGVTHECDYPPEASDKPRVTTSQIDSSRASRDIDAQVTSHFERGQQLYGIDSERLRIDPPDLIVTQDLCPVCAVSPSDFAGHMEAAGCSARVVTLNPNSLGDILENIIEVGEATGCAAEAAEYVASMEGRIEEVRRAVDGAARRRVLCLEWLDPLMPGGHWVPEMVEIAGGDNGPLSAGEPSRKVPWEELRRLEPGVIVLMPCGFGPDRAAAESGVLWALDGWAETHAVRAGEVYAVNGNALFSRPGPRVVDGVETLARILHPDRVMQPSPPGGVLKLVSPPAGGSSVENWAPRFEPWS